MTEQDSEPVEGLRPRRLAASVLDLLLFGCVATYSMPMDRPLVNDF